MPASRRGTCSISPHRSRRTGERHQTAHWARARSSGTSGSAASGQAPMSSSETNRRTVSPSSARMSCWCPALPAAATMAVSASISRTMNHQARVRTPLARGIAGHSVLRLLVLARRRSQDPRLSQSGTSGDCACRTVVVCAGRMWSGASTWTNFTLTGLASPSVSWRIVAMLIRRRTSGQPRLSVRARMFSMSHVGAALSLSCWAAGSASTGPALSFGWLEPVTPRRSWLVTRRMYPRPASASMWSYVRWA